MREIEIKPMTTKILSYIILSAGVGMLLFVVMYVVTS